MRMPKARVQWNREQALRRSLRNLEMRGLVELGPFVFYPWAERREIIRRYIEWWYRDPDNHTPGQLRMMTGALLTDAGRRVAAE